MGDEGGCGLAGLGCGAEGFGKVHLDPKAPRHLGVGLLQGVVRIDRADQHDLDLHIHGLGLQRDGGHGAVRRARLLDLQAAAAQKAAQAFPQAFVAQQVAQVQHEKAPVRLEQAARMDAREVGQQGVGLGLVFDAAEQVAQLRVVLDEHGRAGQAVVVHGQVHMAVGQQRIEFVLALVVAALCAFDWDEKSQVVQHLLVYLVQPLAQLDGVLDLLAQAVAHFLQFMVEQRFGDLAAQLLQGLVALAFQGACGVEEAGDLGTQFLLGGVDLGAAFACEGARICLGQGLALGTD